MPFPPNTGGRIGMFKRIEYFSRTNEIYLFSIIDRTEEVKYKHSMEKYCKSVSLYCREGKKLQSLFQLIKAPYVCESRWFSRMKSDISVYYEKLNPDFVIVDFPQMLGNIPEKVFHSGKLVLNQHNTEYLTLRNISKLFDNPLKRVVGLIESYRLERLEKKYYQRNAIRLFTFVSSEDKLFFENKYGFTNTLLVPVGTEVNVSEKKDKGNFNISYIGKMEYPANAEAAVWFANNVFGKIKADIEGIRYYVVGKNPLRSVKELAEQDADIVVTGTVDDIGKYFEMSDVIVIPLFHGGGVKVKLLEALGHKKLVITTRKGIEGTIFRDKHELLVAEDAEHFKELIKDIFHNPDKYNDIIETGFECVKNNFTWAAIVKNYEEVLKSMI